MRQAVAIDSGVPLELLEAGQWGEVTAVDAEPSWAARMAELGLRIGSRLQVLQPGSPCLLRVGSCRLSLRADVAMQIWVRPVFVG